MNDPTWRIDPPPRDLFDVIHAGDNKVLVKHIGGRDNATKVADGLAERHRTEYLVKDCAAGEVVHRAMPPEQRKEAS